MINPQPNFTTWAYALLYFQVVLAPPLYRSKPLWYQNGLTQVATRFSSIFSTNKPPKLFLLPARGTTAWPTSSIVTLTFSVALT